MNRMIRSVSFALRLARDDAGAAGIEYGVICATMALVMVASLKGLGPAMSDTFAAINHALVSAH